MAIAKGQPTFERKNYTGVANFEILALNPTKEELEKMQGREIEYTPEYVGTQMHRDIDGERDVKYAKFDFFLYNKEFDIRTKATYYVKDVIRKSQGGKVQCINFYGDTIWISPEDLKNNTVPANQSWFDTRDLRAARVGEEELTSFLKCLHKTPINGPWLPAEEKDSAECNIEESSMQKAFTGDFSSFVADMAARQFEVGFAIGVQVAADGKTRQKVFTKFPLKNFVVHQNKEGKFDKLKTAIAESQANNSYADVDFGPIDFKVREYTVTKTEVTADMLPDEEDIFSSSMASEPEFLDTDTEF